jgi:O-antigen ligase
MNQVVLSNRSLFLEYKFALRLTIILTTIFIIVVWITGGNVKPIYFISLSTIILLLMYNYELSLMALVITLFIDRYISMYSSAVIYTVPLGLAFIFRYKDIKWKEFSNPLTIPIAIYGLCIVPSFLNAIKPMTSVQMLYNVVAFLIVMYSIVAGNLTYNNLQKLLIVYLFLVFLNSLDVFRLTWIDSKRPFGFAGIMFVDYSALGVCLTITLAFISKGFKRAIFFLISFIIMIALVFTQTRNAWLSAVITLCILVIYLLVHPELVGVTRKRILAYTSASLFIIGGVVMLLLVYNPKIEKRATELTKEEGYDVDEWGNVANSMVSRYFIWDTALNAFREHPLVGIGVYAFPYSSQHYYKFPKLFYIKLVENRSPHQTHLAVLVETGIIGFCGYLVFIFAALRYAFLAIREAREKQGKRYALVGAIGVVYCVVSMFFTDAWLWGQGIVLLGLVLGLTLANRKICTLSASGV